MCCISMGEAAGTAAAMSIESNVRVRDLDVPSLQRRLDENGVNIGQSYRDVPALGGKPKSHFIGRVGKNTNG